MTAARRITVIGIGSPFGDDRVGWEVVETLERQNVGAQLQGGEIVLVTCARPLSSHLDRLKDFTQVLLVDAVVSGAPLGKLHRIEVPVRPGPEPWRDAGKFSSHGADVMQALALGRELELLPAKVTIFGIEIAATGAEREPAVRAAVPHLAQRILFELEQLRQFD